MRARLLPCLLIAGGLAACATADRGSILQPVLARADLVDATGRSVGTAEFGPSLSGNGALILVKVHGLPAGEHGMHIHQNGVCEGPKFTSAGPHLEYPGRDDPHGLSQPSGGEAGDLPNLLVRPAGSAGDDFFAVENITVTGEPGKVGVIGRAIVIHAMRDDQMSQPIGGSGDRIACGVIQAAG